MLVGGQARTGGLVSALRRAEAGEGAEALPQPPIATIASDAVVHDATASWRDTIGAGRSWSDLFDDADLRALDLLRSSDSCVTRLRSPDATWFALRTVSKREGALIVNAMDVSALVHERDSFREHVEFLGFQAEVFSTFSRVMEMAPVVLWSTDRDGLLTMHAGAGQERVGNRPELGANVFERWTAEQQDAVRRALGGARSVVTEEPAAGVFFETWYMPLRDENDAICGVVGLSIDVTERVRRELENRRQLDFIASQNDTIRSLACPILHIGDDILCVPIIGNLTESRAGEIAERLLRELVATSARVAILDLTGVDTVEENTVASLVRVVRATGLIGARTIVSGVTPAVAGMLVALGDDLSSFHTVRTIGAAIRAARHNAL